MPQPPDWKRALETGIQFTELQRSQARRLASELVAQGQLARDQLGAAVDELVEISRARSEELRKIVSAEVQRQLGGLGLATKRDLEALERRLANSTKAARSATKKAPKTAPAKKAAAKKSPGRKATTKKAATKKAATRKAAAKKAAARKAPRKTVAKAAARKVPAKRAR